MDVTLIKIRPTLHLPRFPVGQACLWCDREELTLIDAGPAGARTATTKTVTGLGHSPGDVYGGSF